MIKISMSQSFIISAVVFVIVMVIFHIIKDIILRGYNINSDQKIKLNNRWLVATGIGLFLLYLMYA